MYNNWLWNLFFSQFMSLQPQPFWCWCSCNMARAQTWVPRLAVGRQAACLARPVQPTFSVVQRALPLRSFATSVALTYVGAHRSNTSGGVMQGVTSEPAKTNKSAPSPAVPAARKSEHSEIVEALRFLDKSWIRV